MNETTTTNSKCGYAAILGAPNAGKSTLLNALVGQKISIVTPKVQTTRFRVRGIVMEGSAQIVFVDTPGIFSSAKGFEKAMVDEAWAGLSDADAALLLIDARKGLGEEETIIIERLHQRAQHRPLPLALCINKIDTITREELLALASACAQYRIFSQFFMISAKKRDGLAALKKWLAGEMPPGPWLYPPDQLTDIPMRLLAAEITREKLFYLLKQELPYSLSVKTETWERRKNGTVAIAQAIHVSREGQKKIIIGDKGMMLKKIGTLSRTELERQLDAKVHLTLFVKVDPQWEREGVIPQ